MSTHSHFQDLKQRHQNVSSWKVGRRLAQYLRPYWKTVAASWAVQTVNLVMFFVPAGIMGPVVRALRDQEYSRLWLYAGIVVGNEILRFGIMTESACQ